MGYQRPALKLTFVDSDLEGLEVRMRRPTVDDMLWISTLRRGGPTDQQQLAEMADRLSAAILGWNLDDHHGAPVPATPQALRHQDFDLLMAVIEGWVDAVQARRPLPPPSQPGDPALAGSLPMETLSPSQPSSTGPD